MSRNWRNTYTNYNKNWRMNNVYKYENRVLKRRKNMMSAARKIPMDTSSDGFTRNVGYYGRFKSGTPELKYKDREHEFVQVDADGEIDSSLNIVAQGDGPSERIGRKIVIKKINIRGYVSWESPSISSPENTYDQLRLIIYLDKQCNGTAATVSDILETEDIRSFNNLSNKSRFKILSDQRFDLFSHAGGSTGSDDTYSPGYKSFTKFIKCNIPIEYDQTATTGVISTIRSNNIGMLAISQNGLLVVETTTRIRYTDG
jgi:hypothetical protein